MSTVRDPAQRREHFDVLLAAWLVDDASPGDQAELHALITAEPAWRDELLAIYSQHRQLAALHSDGADFVAGVTGTLSVASRRVPGSRRFSRRRRAARNVFPVRLLAVAAGLAAALVMAWLASAAPAIGRAERVDSVQVVRSGRTRALVVGDDLRAGDRIQAVGRGSAALRFDDGTFLYLTDGRLDLAHGARGRSLVLAKGTLIADVARQPAGRPLVVDTAHARLTVLGTAFTVEDDADATRLHMEHGRVQLARIADGAAIVVGAGDQVTVAPGRPLVAVPHALADGLVGVWDLEPERLPNFRGQPLPVAGPRGHGVRVDRATFAEVVLGEDDLPFPGTFALAAWVRSDPGMVGLADFVTLSDYFSLRCDASGRFMLSYIDFGQPDPAAERFWPTRQNDYNYILRAPHAVAARAWHHVLGQFTAEGSYELYVDGVLVGSHRTSGKVRHEDRHALVIGHHGGFDRNFKFVGDLDEVRVYRRGLATDEIRALAAAGVQPSP